MYMSRVAKFEKVSYEQFERDWIDTFGLKYNDWDEDVIEKTIHDIYDSIKLPKRATSGSAGYDFFCPNGLRIEANGVAKIPTGIRCKMARGCVLQCYPRSGHGFKYGVHLANTVGIIDEDYYGSDNEGHIFIKLVNDSALAKPIELKAGDAFCQGILIPYGITVDDDVAEVRRGGLGSTDK
jgi:dUTP pyrophosphatase